MKLEVLQFRDVFGGQACYRRRVAKFAVYERHVRSDGKAVCAPRVMGAAA
jgi:hypothetical protein